MSRVAFSNVRGTTYVRVVADWRDGEIWRQRVLASFGRLNPDSHARAILAQIMLDRLDAETEINLRAALEREVVRMIGGDAVNALNQKANS